MHNVCSPHDDATGHIRHNNMNYVSATCAGQPNSAGWAWLLGAGGGTATCQGHQGDGTLGKEHVVRFYVQGLCEMYQCSRLLQGECHGPQGDGTLGKGNIVRFHVQDLCEMYQCSRLLQGECYRPQRDGTLGKESVVRFFVQDLCEIYLVMWQVVVRWMPRTSRKWCTCRVGQNHTYTLYVRYV
jgi:hypothetical protein